MLQYVLVYHLAHLRLHIVTHCWFVQLQLLSERGDGEIGDGRLWIKLRLTRMSNVQFVRQVAATLCSLRCILFAGNDWRRVRRRMASRMEIDSNSRRQVSLRWPADAWDWDCSGSPFINFTTNFIVINITLITLITNITFFYLCYLQVHYKSLEALKVLWCEAQILCDFSGLGLEACFFQTKAQLVEWVIEWLNGLCWSCFNSVTPCLVWSSVGFPHHHQPKLHTNNNWKGTVGCTVWYVNHTHYGLLLGRACGAAYSCVVPSGNPILKKGGRGGYNCSHILILIRSE